MKILGWLVKLFMVGYVSLFVLSVSEALPQLIGVLIGAFVYWIGMNIWARQPKFKTMTVADAMSRETALKWRNKAFAGAVLSMALFVYGTLMQPSPVVSFFTTIAFGLGLLAISFVAVASQPDLPDEEY